jgi:hypothetical protein
MGGQGSADDRLRMAVCLDPSASCSTKPAADKAEHFFMPAAYSAGTNPPSAQRPTSHQQLVATRHLSQLPWIEGHGLKPSGTSPCQAESEGLVHPHRM